MIDEHDDVENEQEVEETEEEETEQEEEETEQEAEATEAEEKPAKKPRKPRSDRGVKRPTAKSVARAAAKAAPKKPGRPAKVKVEEEQEEAPARRGRPKTKLDNFVRQEGSLVTISGADVYCRKLTPKAQAEWGLRGIESGKMGVPCTDEALVLKFKSPKSAAKFFSHSFGTEDESDEIIVAGSKTDWESDALDDFLS